jgi:hypothetical protein
LGDRSPIWAVFTGFLKFFFSRLALPIAFFQHPQHVVITHKMGEKKSSAQMW